MATQLKPEQIRRPWRDEPLVVGKIIDKEEIKYRVIPGYKYASPGDTLVFKFYGIHSVAIKGQIFAQVTDPAHGVIHATLKDSLEPGIYPYAVICDHGHEALGCSPPVIIVDP